MSVSYSEVVPFVFMQVFFSCLRGGLSVFIGACSVFVKGSFCVQIMYYFAL